MIKPISKLMAYLVLLLCACTTVVAQDIVLSKDSVETRCKVNSMSSTLIKFTRTDNGLQDSVETANLRSVSISDSTYVVYPLAFANEVNLLSMSEFQQALAMKDYALLLHAKVIVTDAVFLTGRTDLPPNSRTKLLPFVNLLKAQKGLKYAMYVHTDSIGKAYNNLMISQKRANSLRIFFVNNGIKADNMIVEGKGETEPSTETNVSDRRVELQVTSVEKLQILYSEKYIPPVVTPAPVVEDKKVETPTESISVLQNLEKTEYKPVKRAAKKPISFVLSADGLYAINALSGDWSSKDGIGILQGFGGELMFSYYPKKWLGLTIQGGMSQWKVLRRYMTDNNEVVYTTRSTVQRIPLRIGTRVFLGKAFYIHPQGGMQLLNLTIQNSDTHPQSNATEKSNAFKPIVGGALGIEKKIGKTAILDIGLQYFMTPNEDFSGVSENLHYGGIKLGIGFKND